MAYVGMITVIVVNMTQARNRVMYASDQIRQKDQQDWEDWVKKSNEHQDGQLPVERKEIDLKRRPVSNATTLLIQYYGVCLTGLILFSTLIFGNTSSIDNMVRPKIPGYMTWQSNQISILSKLVLSQPR